MVRLCDILNMTACLLARNGCIGGRWCGYPPHLGTNMTVALLISYGDIAPESVQLALFREWRTLEYVFWHFSSYIQWKQFFLLVWEDSFFRDGNSSKRVSLASFSCKEYGKVYCNAYIWSKFNHCYWFILQLSIDIVACWSDSHILTILINKSFYYYKAHFLLEIWWFRFRMAVYI